MDQRSCNFCYHRNMGLCLVFSMVLIKHPIINPIITLAISNFMSIFRKCIEITMKRACIRGCIGWWSHKGVSPFKKYKSLILSALECSCMIWCLECINMISWAIGLPISNVGWLMQNFDFGLFFIFDMRLLCFFDMWLLFIFGVRLLFMRILQVPSLRSWFSFHVPYPSCLIYLAFPWASFLRYFHYY